jgi:hypothetical protein
MPQIPWAAMAAFDEPAGSWVYFANKPSLRGQYMYCRHEPNRLRDALCQNGSNIAQENDSLVSIYWAANQSVCCIAEVVKLLVSGEIENVSLMQGLRTFDVIRVASKGVFEGLPSYETVEVGMTREELPKHFGVSGATVAFLL